MGSGPVAVTAVIAAAGSGERLGAGGPKAFVPLAGRPMVAWSVEAFQAAEQVGPIVVACPPGAALPERVRHLPRSAEQTAIAGEVAQVEGGETRAESVAKALAGVESELVAIHDAARPLVTAQLVDEVIGTLLADEGAAGAIAATPVADTIKRAGRVGGDSPHAGDLAVGETVDRRELWAAQTPQVFRTAVLRRALEAAGDEAAAATDEAMLVERAGGRVLIHPSPPENLKVTTPLDLRVAELLLAGTAT